MNLRTLALIAAVGCAHSATANEPEERLPPQWDGPYGWQLDENSIHVNEGTLQPGEILVEHGLQLVRTGTLKNDVAIKKPDGPSVFIKKGTKAFATNITSARWKGLNPIEWCLLLPNGSDGKQAKAETVCASWHDPSRSRYHTDVDSGLFFLPRAGRGWTTSRMPYIEEGPVDFGGRLTQQIRLQQLTDKDVTLETLVSDGTVVASAKVNTIDWATSQTLTYYSAGHSLLLTRDDNQSLKVQRLPQDDDPPIAITEYTLMVDMLVRADGTVKEARIAQSGGKPKLDQAALAWIQESWKLTPGTNKKGEPVEMWTRTGVTFKPEEKSKQPPTPAAE